MEKAQRAAATLSPPSGPSRRNTSHANNATSAHSRENGYFPTSPSSGFKSIPHSSPMFDLKRKVSEEGGLRSPFEIGGDRRVTEKQVEVLDGWIAQDSGVQEGDVDGNTLNDLSSLGLNREWAWNSSITPHEVDQLPHAITSQASHNLTYKQLYPYTPPHPP